MSSSTHCPVCLSPSPDQFLQLDRRTYWRCGQCETRFLDPTQLPTPELEHTHYLYHENNPRDPRYRAFLSKLAAPLLERLRWNLSGLDYGSGQGPTLAMMMEEAGHRMTLYDPFFFPDEAALQQTYDVITCTEVAEHFHRPKEEFDRLDQLLRPGGWLGIMTCFQTEDERFSTWHYRRDPTHVVFYREATLRYVAAARGWHCHVPTKDVAIFYKPEL